MVKPWIFFPPFVPLPCTYPRQCVNKYPVLRPETNFLVLNTAICEGGIVLPRGLMTLTFTVCWFQSHLVDRTQGRWESKSLPPLEVLLNFALFKPCRPYGSALATPNYLYIEYDMIYLVCVMCGMQSTLRPEFSLSYVRDLVRVMCRL